MQKIVPHLWFEREAVEAAEFYTSIFPDSKLTHRSVLKNTPSGDTDVVGFKIMDFEFRAISAGPYFKKNPSISFSVYFDSSDDKGARKNLDDLWEKLSEGGKVLMPIQKYPWSKRYGWVQDRYNVSWQLTLSNTTEDRPKIVPSLLFTNEKSGKAEEAIKFYISLFKNSKLENITHYQKDQGPNKKGTVMFSDFKLADIWLTAMDGGNIHDFTFNEAISLMINCESQQEIDYYWNKLSAEPEAEQCGWLKDSFGVSWQVVPAILDEMIEKGTEQQINNITETYLKMKKFDIQKLMEAYEGNTINE